MDRELWFDKLLVKGEIIYLMKMIVLLNKKNFFKNMYYLEVNFYKCFNFVNCFCELGVDYYEICIVMVFVINNVMFNCLLIFVR